MAQKKLLLCNCPDLKVDLTAVVAELAVLQVESSGAGALLHAHGIGQVAGNLSRSAGRMCVSRLWSGVERPVF